MSKNTKDSKMLSVERNWREALLSLEVLREALTSRDREGRLNNMDAGKLMVETISSLKELRALLYKPVVTESRPLPTWTEEEYWGFDFAIISGLKP